MEITLYTLVDPRTTRPRYVGQSVDPVYRRRRHLQEATRSRGRSHKLHWLRELQALDMEPQLCELFVVETNVEADELERVLIAGLRDLTNATEGGDVGSRGAHWKLSPERCIAIGEQNRRRAPMSAQGRANIAAANRRRTGTKRGTRGDS